MEPGLNNKDVVASVAMTLDGYKAMQFYFVASSNEGAVKLWNKIGSETAEKPVNDVFRPVPVFVTLL